MTPEPAPLPTPEGPLRFLVIGGGTAPESTEVSLEQDVDLLLRTLPGPGQVLFAGGSGSKSVREQKGSLEGDSLRTSLGELFAPRAGRSSRYRPPRFQAERATLRRVEETLALALSAGTSPLLVHVAAHGDQGATARENSVALWGGGTLTVSALAALHEAHRRPLRLVATSCFSGGFAELAFAQADDARGPSPILRCGLFAGPWDRETSGCDPDPDRRAQESHALHFVSALGGKRRDGSSLSLEQLDADGNGVVGLLDAHTWARIEAVSLDVPTTTSERWLRHAETGTAAPTQGKAPEEDRVVERLGRALSLPTLAAVNERRDQLAVTLRRLDDEFLARENERLNAEADLRSEVLSAWPVLDDPYHPDFESMLRENRDRVSALVTNSAESKALREATARTDAADAELIRVELEEARVERLFRAHETRGKAAALLRRGGPDAEYYLRLLSCERGAP